MALDADVEELSKGDQKSNGNVIDPLGSITYCMHGARKSDLKTLRVESETERAVR